MEKKLTEKIALVTGGGSGIGWAIAEKFVRGGLRTIILGRDSRKLEKATGQLGPQCIPVKFDLDDLSAIPALIDRLTAEHGHVDVLVNNAGINLKKELTEVTDAEFSQVLLTNVSAVFSLTREVARKLIEQGRTGSIIHISSMASRYGIPKVIAYTASKAAIEGMTRAMAVDLSPKGIRVNCIAPGFIATDMSARALNNDPERKAKVLSRTPLSRLGDPADIAETAFFLASDAARFITGVVLPVDGGNSIGF